MGTSKSKPVRCFKPVNERFFSVSSSANPFLLKPNYNYNFVPAIEGVPETRSVLTFCANTHFSKLDKVTNNLFSPFLFQFANSVTPTSQNCKRPTTFRCVLITKNVAILLHHLRARLAKPNSRQWTNQCSVRLSQSGGAMAADTKLRVPRRATCFRA